MRSRSATAQKGRHFGGARHHRRMCGGWRQRSAYDLRVTCSRYDSMEVRTSALSLARSWLRFSKARQASRLTASRLAHMTSFVIRSPVAVYAATSCATSSACSWNPVSGSTR